MENQSKHFPDCFHRVTIKGMCVREGKLLMIRESENASGKWELPGGGLDFGESILEAFAREVEEEMGMKVTKMSSAPVYTWTWKYTGKRELDWFYVCVLAYREEFVDLNFIPTEECEEIKFFSKDELKTLDTNGQMVPLPEIFNHEDFKKGF